MGKFNWNFLNKNSFIVLNIETSGLNKTFDSIIEIAAIKYVNGKIVDKFSTFVKPLKPIDKKTTDLTGITNEMLINAPIIDDVLYKFKEFIEDMDIVGYCISFDWNFLLRKFKEICIYPNNITFDVFALAKKTFPKEEKNKLIDVCERLNIKTDNSHRALNDTERTLEVFLKLKEMNKDKIDENKYISKTEEETKEQNIVDSKFYGDIKRVSSWNKKRKKDGAIQQSRQYIFINNNGVSGQLYFDNLTKTWHNVDYPNPLNIKEVELKVLKFLGLKTKDDLVNYSSFSYK